MVCGVVCIVYSILPLRVLLNLKQVLVLHVGKNVSVVVGEFATLSLHTIKPRILLVKYCAFALLG